jgi:hypothetical protein
VLAVLVLLGYACACIQNSSHASNAVTMSCEIRLCCEHILCYTWYKASAAPSTLRILRIPHKLIACSLSFHLYCILSTYIYVSKLVVSGLYLR